MILMDGWADNGVVTAAAVWNAMATQIRFQCAVLWRSVRLFVCFSAVRQLNDVCFCVGLL